MSLIKCISILLLKKHRLNKKNSMAHGRNSQKQMGRYNLKKVGLKLLKSSEIF